MAKNKKKTLLKPHLWFQLYWVLYLVWFFALDLAIKDPPFIIHSRLDDLIPFCEWFILPYGSWYLLLAGVTAALWWMDTPAYDKLCLMMFSGMTFCLILYMILPNGLNLRPDPATLGRMNPALALMQLLWKADAAVNVCPSIHCQSTACMALAFHKSRLAQYRPGLKILAWLWAGLICVSTVFTKQHSVIDVACGLAVAAVWYPILYGGTKGGRRLQRPRLRRYGARRG